jgi:2-polyprenyl-3-methyl-5-hydroxy-6-metoxy-1,4-benzoquinol methylase
MGKQNEIDYLKKIGPDGQRHAFNKPYSDQDCWRYFADLGTIFYLLPSPPAKLLDLGVGTGWTSIFFARRGYDVVGQDIAEDAILLAEKNKERQGINNVQFKVCDYEELDFSNEFDCAVFYDCLHHSANEEKALAAVYNALKPQGICITVEPGTGHEKVEGSKKAMALYGVIERDMPAGKIIRAGKKAGFRKFKVYLRYSEPIALRGKFAEEMRGIKRICGQLSSFFPAKGAANIVVLIK